MIPDNDRKTSTVECFTAHATKAGRQPARPKEGMLSIPGPFSRAASTCEAVFRVLIWLSEPGREFVFVSVIVLVACFVCDELIQRRHGGKGD